MATGVLNAVIIDTVKSVNREPQFIQDSTPVSLYDDSLCLPAPIHDYIESVASALSPLGDIRINVPEIAIPQEPVATAGQVPAQHSGGFGPLDAAGHNAYECYASPLVTARRIEATVQQNTPPVAFGAWQPQVVLFL